MKKLAVFLCALGAVTVFAQAQSPGPALQYPGVRPGQPPTGFGPVTKANEIAHANVAYRGLAVQVYKAHNPLQLVNPGAPPQYGSTLDNLDYNPTTGRFFGLKIFSLRF
jgi:hypothetical protein